MLSLTLPSRTLLSEFLNPEIPDNSWPVGASRWCTTHSLAILSQEVLSPGSAHELEVRQLAARGYPGKASEGEDPEMANILSPLIGSIFKEISPLEPQMSRFHQMRTDHLTTGIYKFEIRFRTTLNRYLASLGKPGTKGHWVLIVSGNTT